MALTVIKPSGLELSGNFTVTSLTASSNVSAGNIKTDNLLYANGAPYVFGSGTPGGTNTQVQFNDANSFSGSANFTFDKTTNTLSVTNIVANGSGLTSLTGANVTGQVSYAATANSVAGANVTGAVSYATTANSVAVGNVSGIGNIATLNLDGNASNILYGNGVFAAPAATSTYGNSNVASLLASFGSNTITTTGNVQVGNIIGNGQALTGLNGANVTGQVSNATVAGTVYTNAQPNITSVGTLTSLDVTGTSNLGNVGNVKITGGTASYVLSTDGTGNLSWVAQSGGGGGASISNGTSNLNIPTSDGNITATVNGNSNIAVITGTGANVNGYLTVSGVSNLGNVGNVKITGGTSGLFLSTDGAGNLNWAAASATELANGTSNIKIATANGNVTFSVNGNANVLTVAPTSVVVGNGTGGSITDLDALTANYIQGTLTANSATQPNITSIGNLISLTVTGVTTLGSNSNVKISGGTSGQFIRTDGAGNLTWANGSMQIATDNATNATYYPVFATSTSGTMSNATIANTKFQFNPSSGQLTVTDLNTTSDMTLKDNITPIMDPISIIRQLDGFGFNWKDNGKKSYGLMAQLLEKVLPELVNYNAQGLKTVNYLPLIAFLIEAIKVQQDDIEQLKAKR